MMEKIPQERVRLLPGIFKDRRDINTEVLLSFDPRALLQNYMLEAGEIPAELRAPAHPEQTFLHWGYESPTSPLRGHFLGHWMSAAAFIIQTEKNRVLRARLFDIIDKLREYQLKNGGKWVAPIPEKYFEFLLAEKKTYAPQYVMHKLFMGLLDAYECTAYTPALTIMSHLSDWYLDYFERSEDIDPGVALRGGSAGMLEIWVRLYRLTGEEKYRSLLKRYQYPALFTLLRSGEDPLSNQSAKALIPWVLGAARIYEIKRSEEWLAPVRTFWEHAVNRRGFYASGSADSDGAFIPPDRLAEYAGDKNQEFCTVFHMVRLADELFRFTGDTVYADYIERCLYNGFLAQQHPKSGMVCRYLPQKAGARKDWGAGVSDFSCCMGTMLQAYAMINSLIFYRDDDKVTVGQYIPSRAEFKICGTAVVLELSECRDDESRNRRFSFYLRVRCARPQRFLLRLRIPDWIKGMPQVSINSERRFVTEDVIREGYLKLDREWSDQMLRISFPEELTTEALPDERGLKAVMDGPVVLAALSEGLQLDEEPAKILKRHSVNADKPGNSYRCRLRGIWTDLIPLYEVEDQQYSVYQTFPFKG